LLWTVYISLILTYPTPNSGITYTGYTTVGEKKIICALRNTTSSIRSLHMMSQLYDVSFLMVWLLHQVAYIILFTCLLNRIIQ